MKIAIPTVDGLLCPHFGHCQQFAVLDVDPETKSVTASEMLTPPPHEPGVLPAWLSQMGCNIIIAGGMGGRAVDMFQQNGIKVVIGAPNGKPEEIVIAYLSSELTTGANPCDDPAFHGDKPCGD
ncbi:MAG: NifB/NifX family molybdenum-iron cluster-binding protein [candidate division Zixibacteria bacterium]|jgi:predicted Fe-Mo cluster-binding NifX family protein|nr:NifB/NifX family molybdenum-iron cluster-binding protein [candidate division Zixibacteria bacterium]